MTKRTLTNKLNELSPKDWVKFEKSWFIHNPPARQKNVLRHPAKFPETMVMEFITFFTKPNQVVLDPMAGTGSTLVAALRLGRQAYGIELNPIYADIARQVTTEEVQKLESPDECPAWELITGNADNLDEIAATHHLPPVDYVITSPPYWDMLHAQGATTQKARRASAELDVTYSNDPNDLGNIGGYEEFLERLAGIYIHMQPILRQGAYMTIIVKNIKKGGKVFPLAWDLAHILGGTYALKDEKIWCQDNQRLLLYGFGSTWVSNTFHHYCLQFRNE